MLEELAKLNFEDLLQYGGKPAVKHKYDQQCSGYCVSCEKKYPRLDLYRTSHGSDCVLMSHGCDTEDFETVVGHSMPRLPGRNLVEFPVLFLLLDPGHGYQGNGDEISLGSFRKRPPTKHYYWTPTPGVRWEDLRDHIRTTSGNYFAYLMWMHQLRNVYITNLRKCSSPKGTTWADRFTKSQNCFTEYLSKELRIFQPRLIFCFGLETYSIFRELSPESNSISTRLLHHKAHMPLDELIKRNDKCVIDALTAV